MDSGISKTPKASLDIFTLPYGRINYIRFEGTSLSGKAISAFLRPQRCVQF